MKRPVQGDPLLRVCLVDRPDDAFSYQWVGFFGSRFKTFFLSFTLMQLTVLQISLASLCDAAQPMLARYLVPQKLYALSRFRLCASRSPRSYGLEDSVWCDRWGRMRQP